MHRPTRPTLILIIVVALATWPAGSVTRSADTTASPGASAIDKEALVLHEWFLPDKGTKNLFLAEQDGTDRHVILADLPGEHRVPAWSPDGDQIAFVVRDEATPNGSIWIADTDGSNPHQLFDPATLCPWGAYHPAWSRDGLRLAIVCYPAEPTLSTLAVVDLETLELDTLATVTYPEVFDSAASWSPDGSALAYSVLRWDPTDTFLDGSLIATVPAGGGEPTRLSGFESFDASPDWHPSEDLIAFNTHDLGNTQSTDEASNLFTMRSDGSERRQLTTTSTDGRLRIAQPRWTPDGTGIVAAIAQGDPVHFVEVAFVDPDSGAVTMPNREIPGAHPDVRPTR